MLILRTKFNFCSGLKKLDNIDDAFLLKISDGKVSATTGLDYLTPLHLNVLAPDQFWGKTVCTFRIQGTFLLNSVLEFPELLECFTDAKVGFKLIVMDTWGGFLTEI